MVVQVHFHRSVIAERLAAIVRDVQVDAVDVDPLRVIGIDANLAEVHRPRIEAADLGPRLAFVLGAEHAAVAVLDDGVNDVRVAAIEVEADAAGVTGWKAAGDLAPGPAGIAALVNARVRPAAVEPISGAAPRIRRRDEHLRIGGIHDQVGGAGVLVDGEDVLPGDAAVGGLEDAALFVGAPQPAHRRHVDDVGVLRVDDDAADVLRVAQAHVLPGLAAVDRLVDAVTPRGALAIVRFAGAHPHDVGIGRVDGDVADRHRGLGVEHVLPRVATIDRLQQTAGRRRRIEDRGVGLVHREVRDAPAHEDGPDVPAGDAVEDRVWYLREDSRCRKHDSQEEDGATSEHKHLGRKNRKAVWRRARSLAALYYDPR